LSGWPTATRRRRATPPSSTCIPRPASVTRWETSFTAFRNRTPLLITAGQQARAILPFDPFLYSAQATELPKPYVKWSVEPARAEDVPLAIARAYYIAMQPPRGPVLVSIPADDWARRCEPSSRAT
jgi:thiamine pyrophosphate-dependent acetolactate synthase large subunit-like protein